MAILAQGTHWADADMLAFSSSLVEQFFLPPIVFFSSTPNRERQGRTRQGKAGQGRADFSFGRLTLCFLVGFIVLLCLVIADEQELHQTYKGMVKQKNHASRRRMHFSQGSCIF